MQRAIKLALVVFALSSIAIGQFAYDEQPRRSPAQALQLPGTGTVNVTVVDDAGRLVGGATVVLDGSAAGVTSADGVLTLADVLVNETGRPYLMWANQSGYVNSTVSECIVVEGELTNVTLTLVGTTILGTVTDATGGILGASVSIFELSLSVTVNVSDGSYRMEGVRAGLRSITANASGYVAQTRNLIVPVGDSLLVSFELSSEYGSVSGHVYHSTLTTPLNGTNVSIQIGAITLTVMSDESGSYNLTGVPEGTYSIMASRDGFYPTTLTSITVTRGNRTNDVDFYLTEEPTRLYGTVRSESLLLNGVNITVVGTTYFNTSAADGTYEIWNLTAGTYVIIASKSRYADAEFFDVVVPQGGSAKLDINMVRLPGGVISGRVANSQSKTPLVNVLVSIVSPELQTTSVSTNTYGEYELPGLEPGNYVLRFEKVGFQPIQSRELNVSKDSNTTFNLEMTPIRKGFVGFIFGFDMAHSMMILALFLTIVILAMAVYLRIRTFQAPESAPAVYDQVEEEEAEKKAEAELEKSAGEKEVLDPDLPESARKQ